MTERKCIGCGAIKDVKELIKGQEGHFEKLKNGKVIVNPNSKIFGRSAYLCYNEKCKELAFKKNRLNRALKSSQDLKGLLNGREY